MGLTDEQSSLLIKTFAIDKANYQAIDSVKELTDSQLAQAGTTDLLSNAVVGLKLKLKALWATILAHPFIALGAAVGAATMAYIAHKNAVAEATKESGEKFKETAKSLDDYASRYQELRDELIDSNTTEKRQIEIKKDLLEIQKDLNEEYGTSTERIDLVTDAYKNQLSAIKDIKKREAREWLTDNNEGVSDAIREMEKIRTYDLSGTIFSNTALGKEIRTIAEKYQDRGVKIEDTLIDEGGIKNEAFTVELSANALDAEQLMKEFSNDLYGLIETYGHGFADVVLEKTQAAQNELNVGGIFTKGVLENYKESYINARMNQITADDSLLSEYEQMLNAAEEYNTAVAESKNPFDDEKVDEAYTNLKKIESAVESNQEKWGKYKFVTDDIFKQANTDSYEFVKHISSGNKEINGLVNSISGISEDDFLLGAEYNVDTLNQKLDEAIQKRKELYSGTNYVGNVDINNRPVITNDDGTYSTTSTGFQEGWYGDEETGGYRIIHFTPILPDGTVLNDTTLNDYVNKVLNSSDPIAFDNPTNGGLGIVYKVDTEVNGKKITDGNLQDAFDLAESWDIAMHQMQEKIYGDEGKLKVQIDQTNAIKSIKEIAKTFDLETNGIIDVLKILGIIIDDTFGGDGSGTGKDSLSISGIVSTIDTISEEMKPLNELYEQFDKNGPGNFTNEAFASVIEGFKDIEGLNINGFLEVLSNSSSTADQVQQAFNNLATEYLHSKEFLDKLTESNADYVVSEFKKVGIMNSDQLVTEALARKHAEEAWATGQAENATYEQIHALSLETEATEGARFAFELYIAQKLLNRSISEAGTLEQLSSVVNALEIATQAWQSYYAAKSQLEAMDAGTKKTKNGQTYYEWKENKNGRDVTRIASQESYDQIQRDAKKHQEDLTKEIEEKTRKAKIDVPTTTSSGGGGDGSDSTDTKEFDWIQRKIEILRDQYTKYNDEVNDSNNSYRTQLNYLSEAERYLQEIVATEKQAEGIYFANWEQASAGLSDDIKSKITNGNLSIEEYSSNSEAIDKAQAAWNEYKNQIKTREDDEEQLQALQDSEHTKRVEQLDEQIERAKALGDASYISYGDSDASLAVNFEEIKTQISEAKEELKDYKENWKAAKEEIKDAAKEAGVSYTDLIAGIEDGTLDPLDYEWDQDLRSALVEGVDEYQQLSDANSRITELKTELTTEQKNLANAMNGTSLGYYETVVDLHRQIVDEVKKEVDAAKIGWEEAKQALIEYGEENENVNASNIIADVMNSKADLTKFADNEALKELVENVIDSYGRYENYQKELEDEQMELEEARREAYEKAIEYVEAQQNEIEQINATIQSEMDLINASGGLIIESSYQEMIRHNDELIGLYEDQLELIEDRLGEVEEESAEYYELQGQIQEVTQNINKAKQEQAEWNYEIKMLPIKRIEKFLTILDAIKDNLQGFIDWENTLGITNSKDEFQQMIDLDSERITKLQEQLDKYKEVIESGEYEYGSEKYNELVENINSVGSAISDAANEQSELNKQILNLPVDKITELNEELQVYQDILQSQLDEQETTLSAITGLLQQEMDKLSEQQEEITDNFDEQIEAIDEQLEALDKENEALDKQRAIEQALYDLEKAKNQKNIRVR